MSAGWYRRHRAAPGGHGLLATARLLAGGLVALAGTVLVVPALLGGPGPGGVVVGAHAVAAGAALAAVLVAERARPGRGAPLAALVVALGALATLLVGYWWA